MDSPQNLSQLSSLHFLHWEWGYLSMNLYVYRIPSMWKHTQTWKHNILKYLYISMCENGGKVILEIRSSRKIETEIGRDIEIDKERKRKERREKIIKKGSFGICFQSHWRKPDLKFGGKKGFGPFKFHSPLIDYSFLWKSPQLFWTISGPAGIWQPAASRPPGSRRSPWPRELYLDGQTDEWSLGHWDP